MAEGDERLPGMLDEYDDFLREKKSAAAKHQTHLARRAREFLRFARRHVGYTSEQTLGLFLGEVAR